jgi:hypothetical protein
MSGMFERKARRRAGRSDEPSEPTADTPAGDAPTERIDAVAPESGVDQPTAAHAVVAPAQPAAAAEQPAVVPAQPAAAAEQPAVLPVQPATAPEPAAAVAPARPGFRARGRMRRRVRYLRKLRDLQVRDLGGLVFDLRRFARQRDDLVAQKLDQIRACDDELRALESALGERRDLRDVREPGIGGTCPRCFAVFGSADRFCATCGAALGGAVQGPAQVTVAPPAAPAAPAAPPEAAGSGRDPV